MISHHTAQETWEPTPLERAKLRQSNVIPLSRPVGSAELAYVEQKIADKERDIAKLMEELRWLRLERDSLA